MRNLAGSAGISIMLAMLVNFSAAARGQLIEPYSQENAMVQSGALPPATSIADPTGVVALSVQIDRQSAMLGYTQVFHLMFMVTLAMMPLVMLMRMPKQTSPMPQAPPAEH